MDFINLDSIEFYEPPTQGRSSFDDERNRSLDARVPFGNEQRPTLEECNGWVDVSSKDHRHKGNWTRGMSE